MPNVSKAQPINLVYVSKSRSVLLFVLLPGSTPNEYVPWLDGRALYWFFRKNPFVAEKIALLEPSQKVLSYLNSCSTTQVLMKIIAGD